MSNFATRLKEIIQAGETFKEKREFGKAQNLYTDWLTEALDRQKDSVLTFSDKDSWNENIALAFNNRGQLKYLAVDFDGAIEDYNKALEYNPRLASGFYNRGTILYRMGYFGKAEEDLATATRLAPNCEEFLIGLERCKIELRKSQ